MNISLELLIRWEYPNCHVQ